MEKQIYFVVKYLVPVTNCVSHILLKD